MEALGTPMGGGALKLEATHLRRLPVPLFDDHEIEQLRLVDGLTSPEAVDEIVARALLGDMADDRRVFEMNDALRSYVVAAERARQKKG